MTSHDHLYQVLSDFFASCTSAGDAETVDHLVELELSLSQVKALFVLAHADEPLAINVLAERIRLSVAAAGRVVDLLVGADMVERRESPEDRRVKLVTLTAAGLEATVSHIETKKAIMRDQIACLTADEAADLASALQPLLRLSKTEQEIPA